MNDYRILSVSHALTEMVRQILRDSLDILPERIDLGTPGDKVDLELFLYLYDIRKVSVMQNSERKNIGKDAIRFPSEYYYLYYMLVPYSYGDIKYRTEEELRIFDVLLCEMTDRVWLGDGDNRLEIELLDLELQDKLRVWNGINVSYHLALYSRIGPVEVESGKTKEIKRVTDWRVNSGVKDAKDYS